MLLLLSEWPWTRSAACAGSITFDSALPISKGEAILRGQVLLARASDDPSALTRSLRSVAASIALGFGTTERLALFAVVPFVAQKSLDQTTPTGRVNRSSSGFADSSLFARYTLLQRDRTGETLRLAPFAGFEAPTGEDEDSDRLGRLPRPLQPGSGSWDFFLGLALSRQTLAWEGDIDAGYRFNTGNDDFKFGDVAFADASFQYRLLPRELGSGVPGFLYGVIETNMEWQEKSRVEGRVDPDSGGFRWYVDPGMQFVTRRYVLEAIVRLPAFEALNGQALGADYEVRVGFRWNFPVPYL